MAGRSDYLISGTPLAAHSCQHGHGRRQGLQPTTTDFPRTRGGAFPHLCVDARTFVTVMVCRPRASRSGSLPMGRKRRPPCKHCKRTTDRAERRRGLCDTCYRKPWIRRKYPPEQQRHQDFFCPVVLPQRTDAPPGTEAKLAEIMRRVARRESTTGPDDAKRNLE